MLNRRNFLRTSAKILALTSMTSFSSCIEGDKLPEKPNILFLFTDDQRFSTLNALNNPGIKTPNLDKLVKKGSVFTNTHIMGSMCGAVCMPSRNMLMTSDSLFELKQNGRIIPENKKTFPELFKQNGYHTFITGKWHQDGKSLNRSFSSIDRVMIGGMSDHYKVPLRKYDPTGKYTRKDIYYIEGRHSTELFTESTLKFLDKQTPEKSFLAFTSFTAPHDPRDMPKEFLEMYPADKIELPENFMRKHPFDNGELDVRDELLAEIPRKPQEVKENIAAYYAMITHLDYNIGKILNKLESKGLADKTLIVFSADNGLAVGQHGLMGKQNLYEHSIKVPLVFAGPAIPSKKINTYCYLQDIYPTLCNFANIKPPKDIIGRSLSPAIEKNKNIRDKVVAAYKNFQRSIKKEGMKLILYEVYGHKNTQLFDLENDPLEKNNLANIAEYQPTVRKLTAELQKELNRLGDEIQFGKQDWGVDEIPSWQKKIEMLREKRKNKNK